MLKLARLSAILAAAALAAGCFEGKADFTFNPDGSGKVVGELLFPSRAPWLQKRYSSRPADPNAPAEPAANPEDEMRECVAAMIKRSAGIDAWKDVLFQRAADGRVQFKGTASGADFDHYRILVGQGLNPQEWVQVVSDATTPVVNGILGTWDTSGMGGLYAVQLQVVRTDQRVDTAVTQVTISNK